MDLLRASDRRRVANLLPIKAARMAASPFGFYRGAIPVMASDLSMLPNTGIYAQLCGDAHVHNLGAFEETGDSSSTSTTLTKPFADFGNGM
jgi:uncharacterized protein (DUF2252 family)